MNDSSNLCSVFVIQAYGGVPSGVMREMNRLAIGIRLWMTGQWVLALATASGDQ